MVFAKDTHCLKQEFPIHQENQKNIRFVLSETALTAKVLERNLTLQKRIRPMVSLLRGVVKAIDSRRDHNDIRKCNLELIIPNWVYTARLNARFFQIGDLSRSCYSQLHGREAVKENLLTNAQVKDSMKDIGSGVQALYEASKNAVDGSTYMDSKQWRRTFPLRNWRNQDLPEQCQLETFSAYRIRNDVYIRAAVTNHDVDEYVQDGDRQFVMEWVKQDYSTSLRMVQPKLREKCLVNGSTILWKRGARAWLSWHGEMKEDSNPAIQEVLRSNQIEIELAEDAVAPSNIALLALPLVMSFIPVAFLAELNTCGVLWYIVFTDIISAVPLLIKGIELVGTTNSRQELVAYYAGDKNLADVQVWVAKCSGTNRFRNIGMSFIVIASASIIVGMVLEVCGMIYMRSKSQEGKPVEGPFGKAMFEITARSVLGTGHGEDWERYSEVMEDAEDVRLSVGDADYSRDAPEAKYGPWKDVILRILSSVSFSSNHVISEKPAGKTSRKSEESDEAEDYTAGVGDDGMSSAERVEMGLSYGSPNHDSIR